MKKSTHPPPATTHEVTTVKEEPTRPDMFKLNPTPPALGRIVNFVIPVAASVKAQDVVRPAIIVHIDDANETVNLQVFTNAGYDDLPPVYHAREVKHDESVTPDGMRPQNTWHWPPPRVLAYGLAPAGTDPAPPNDEAHDDTEGVFEPTPSDEINDEKPKRWKKT